MRAAPSGVLNGTVIVSDGYTGPSISSIFTNTSTTDVAEMDFLLSAALVSGRPAVVLQSGTGSIDLLARL
jgi:hypothetical protein